MVDKARVELTSRGGLCPALPSATYPYKMLILILTNYISLHCILHLSVTSDGFFPTLLVR